MEPVFVWCNVSGAYETLEIEDLSPVDEKDLRGWVWLTEQFGFNFPLLLTLVMSYLRGQLT